MANVGNFRFRKIVGGSFASNDGCLENFRRCDGGGFVGGVLGGELAGEGHFEDGLAEGFAALQGGVDLALALRNDGELLVEEADDFLLLGEGTEGDGDGLKSFNADFLLRHSPRDEPQLFSA